MNITRRRLLILLPAAAIAWKHVLAGTPEESPNYKLTEHWWGMLVDVTKCIGCGNCVRACQTENEVPDGYYRTWVERYHVEGLGLENPMVDSPDGGKNGFPPAPKRRKKFLRPQVVQPLRGLTLHPGLSRRRDLCQSRRRGSDRSEILPRLPLLRAGVPLWLPLHSSAKETAEKCTLCYHRITKGLTTACCESCPTGARQLADLKNPKDPIHEFLKTHSIQVLKPYMATNPKVFYNGLDGSVR